MKINQNQIFGKTHTQFYIDEKLWLVEGEECWETVEPMLDEHGFNDWDTPPEGATHYGHYVGYDSYKVRAIVKEN